ncbi:hypothetical protein ACFSE1_14425 [Rhizobium helianthi]|uniref:Uncharacterized protein n=1 Tax=Rhizobium helianthi TaxID=1132695 RepID=A0ABW4M8W7_9HYPH
MKIATLALAFLAAGAGAAMAQQGPDSRTYNSDDYKPRQRYVCVVPPPRSADQQYPNVCRAPEGRVGGSCRCPNVTGTGTLQLGG